MRASGTIGRFAVRVGVASAIGLGVVGDRAGADPGPAPSRNQVAEGAWLFARDWSRVDRDERRGDGLGPMFNARSCVACHGQGGTGGSGKSGADVLILTEIGTPRKPDGKVDFEKLNEAGSTPKPVASEVFPGFATAPSVVLHRAANDPGYDLWRSEVLSKFGLGDRTNAPRPARAFRVRSSRRNTPALFGSGLIDAIPDSAIEEAARREHDYFPKIEGRPGRLEGGRIGRFGWKAQTATLGDFVRIACANELGLENPGHAQPPDPLRPGYKAPDVDLTEAECSSITAYVAGLARPVETTRPALLRAAHIEKGRRVFDSTGCAVCHAPRLGEVAGIYSDLLLHDMGQGLSDSGEYYGTPPSPGLAIVPPRGAEWRTPPLWGLRDSAPYLHDGRASTVSGAIAQHGGQAQESVNRYGKLDPRHKGYLHEFLLSLAAPPKPGSSRASTGY
jgi:CxxC motif-containing protein (DUF1111 family)